MGLMQAISQAATEDSLGNMLSSAMGSAPSTAHGTAGPVLLPRATDRTCLVERQPDRAL
jgi:hypothetical protein